MQHKLIALALACASLSGLAEVEKYEFDATHTYPSFEIDHLGFSTIRGLFRDSKGSFTIDREAKKATVEAVIDAKSIETGMTKRDDHLRNKDFFHTEKFPTLVFKSSAFKFDAEKPVEASGELTMLGETRPVTLKIQLKKCGVRASDQKYVCGGEVTTSLRRSEWGMTKGVPFVGDEVKIAIGVEMVRQTP